MNLWNIEKITYKRKAFDRGVILARRTYRSELARTQKPCQLFEGKFRISFQTPHKKNLVVFVPASELSAGKVLTWLHYCEHTGNTLETVLKLTDVSEYHAIYEILNEEERHFQRRKTRQMNVKLTSASFGLGNNPFVLHNSETLGPTAPDLIVWNSRTFRKQSNFCFVYDSERKKRTGTAFRQVFPEEITEETFRYDFEPYDLLTGRKLDTWTYKVRQAHFQQGLKPAPTWKEM